MAASQTRPSPRRGRLARVVPAVIVLLACLGSLVLSATPQQRTSGDEPHYLVTALSLARDGSLDVADAYAAETYRPFHAPDLEPQGRALDDGRVVEPHDPLLPALLALPTAAAGWPGAKVAVAVLAAAAAWVLAGALAAFGASPTRAATVVIALLATAPFAVYGTQIYPEVPAALAVAGGLAAVLGPVSRARAVAALAAVVALPWLSVKHVPVAAVLAAALLVRWWRAGRRWQAVGLVALLAAAGVGYVAARLAWYDGLTVYAAGRFFAAHGGEASVLGTDPNLLGRASRLLGLLVDRDFGLAAWQPAWLLLVPAGGALLRQRPAGWATVAAVLGVGWLNATFLAATMHGFWFPGRHVVAVLPAAAVAVGWWAAGSRTRMRVAVGVALAGAVSYAALLWGAARGTTTAIFFAGSPDPWRWAWTRLLPDYTVGGTLDWVLHGAWAVAALVLAWVGWRAGGCNMRRWGRVLSSEGPAGIAGSEAPSCSEEGSEEGCDGRPT